MTKSGDQAARAEVSGAPPPAASGAGGEPAGSLPTFDPVSVADDGAIARVIEARPRDLGGFSVRRALPSTEHRLVGPFIFFDHFGPSALAAGQGIDVRPHPHIALATLSYLFEGEIIHRDSLGSHQAIRPGDVNWMLAGRGIVHSERTGDERRRSGGPLHGIQSWIALPTADEEAAPYFEHHPAATIPHVTRAGAELDVVVGTAYGARSPVPTCSPTLYVVGALQAGATLPLPEEHPERALYLVEGSLACGERRISPGSMVVLRSGAVRVRALLPSRFILIGGAPLDGERHIWWNFVASSRERIERAKSDWKAGRFPTVPGDDREHIALPED
jgi:redox-sensitive bicupin YhaK (pirin superfamily)